MSKIFLFFVITFTAFCSGVFPVDREFSREEFVPLITAEEIDQKIQELAVKLNEKYQGKEVVIVMILKGSLFFVADLMRYLDDPVVLQTITCSSYGMKGTKRGKLQITGLDKLDFKDKYVLLVDDVFDSGYTMTTVAKAIKEKKPISLETVILLKKSVERNSLFPDPDYSLFEISDKFVIGYGMDYKEHFRGLEGIYYLPEK